MAKKFWFGMLTMALVFGMAVTGCGTTGTGAQQLEDPLLNGRWIDEEGYEFRFSNGAWEIWYALGPLMRGTYTARDGSTITLITTHLHSNLIAVAFEEEFGFPFDLDPAWHSKDEIIPAMVAAIMPVFIEEEGPFTPEEIAELYEEFHVELAEYFGDGLSEMFMSFTETYTVSGNVLTMTFDGDTMTLTRM